MDNTLGYFENVFTTGGLAYVSLGIFGFFLLSLIWGAFRGLRRGASRQLLHSIFTVVAAVAAFLITAVASNEIFSTMGSMTTEQLLAEIDKHTAILADLGESLRGTIASFDNVTLERLIAVPMATVVLPIVFVLLFIVLNVLLKIVYIIVAKLGGISRHGGIIKHFTGFIIGIAEGAVVGALILVPVFGISGTLTTATEAVRGDENARGFVEFSDACFAPISASPIAPIINQAGGEMIMQKLSTVTIDGEATDMRVHFLDMIEIYAVGSSLVETNWTALDYTDKAAIDTIVSDIDESEYIRDLLAGILRGAAGAVENGYIPVEAEAPYDKLVNELLAIFSGADGSTITADLKTVTTVLYILSDDGILAAINEDADVLTDKLTKIDENGETTVKRLIGAMKKNQRTAGLVSTLTEFSLAMLSESLGIGEDATELYASVKDGIGDVLAIDRSEYETPDEYIDAVSTELDTKLKENNITLDKEIVDEMAKNIHDKELDLGEITEETLDDVILSYYDAYLAGQIELPTP